jgi:hypothetical protein
MSINQNSLHARAPAKLSDAAHVPPAPETAAQRQDALLDDALKETFPASDPVSIVQIT